MINITFIDENTGDRIEHFRGFSIPIPEKYDIVTLDKLYIAKEDDADPEFVGETEYEVRELYKDYTKVVFENEEAPKIESPMMNITVVVRESDNSEQSSTVFEPEDMSHSPVQDDG